MREFRAKAIINAAADDVFKILTNAESYPKFDPNCESVDGYFEQGRKIAIVSKAKPNRFTALISLLQPNETMIWEFGLPFNLLRRVRTFRVIAKDDQTTEFQLSELQTGHFLDVLMHRMPDQSIALQQFAKGLKKFIESRP